jgi:hypothetical protein
LPDDVAERETIAGGRTGKALLTVASELSLHFAREHHGRYWSEPGSQGFRVKQALGHLTPEQLSSGSSSPNCCEFDPAQFHGVMAALWQ